MNTIIRSTLLAAAFAITVAGAVTGLTMRGETKEASLEETCAHATWPMIPAACLEGGRGIDVRTIAIAAVNPVDRFELRFASAFQ